MKTNLITRLTTIALLTAGLLLCGCGGDNPIPAEMPAAMDTATGTVGDTSAPDNMITGNIVKGPVQGAVVIIYSFDGTTELGRGETDANGSFTISIGDNAGGIIVSASGGTYTDEATGAENVQFGATQMRAAYMIPESMTAPFTISINVTPFTEIAVRDALVNGVVDAQLLAGANNNFFELGDNVIDILRTLPTNTLIDSANEQTPEDLYGLFLAAVSQIINSEGLAGWEEAVSLLQTSTMTDNLLSAAITTLGSIDSNAGANISVSAASSALPAWGLASPPTIQRVPLVTTLALKWEVVPTQIQIQVMAPAALIAVVELIPAILEQTAWAALMMAPIWPILLWMAAMQPQELPCPVSAEPLKVPIYRAVSLAPWAT